MTGGVARGLRLKTLRSLPSRPTSDRVRTALFQIVGAAVSGGKVLDLYAGTGALGIEALSRGAAWADFVEADARLCALIRENLKAVGFAGAGRVYPGRVERALELLSGPYGVVFLDPPYALSEVSPVLEQIIRRGMLAPDGMMVVEHSRRAPLEGHYPGLKRVDLRRYGDTAISLYQRESGQEERDDHSPLSRDL